MVNGNDNTLVKVNDLMRGYYDEIAERHDDSDSEDELLDTDYDSMDEETD